MWEISTDGGETWVSTNVKATGEDGIDAENPQQLDFYPLSNGTYGVAIGHAVYLETIVIPATYHGKAVTRIVSEGFKNAPELKSIEIPDSVTLIDKNAFEGCTLLSDVRLPSGLLSITDNTFKGCVALTSITLPETVTGIYNYAFQGAGLTAINIPNSVVTIGESAFADCIGITELTIPEKVTSIRAGAFENCTALTKIYFNATHITKDNINLDTFSGAGSASDGIAVVFGASVEKVPMYLFGHDGAEGKSSPNVKTVTFAEGSTCTDINGESFMNCTSLQSIVFPPSLKAVYRKAFYNTSLTSVELPEGVTELKTWAFAECTLLSSVTLPESMKNIDESAFNGCAAIESLIIPANVTAIGKNTFYGCTNLANVTFVNPHGWSAGETAISATELAVSATAASYLKEDYCAQNWARYSVGLKFISNGDGTCYVSDINTCTDTNVLIPTKSPDGDLVTAIGAGAFKGNDQIVSVVIPASVTEIGVGAFFNCVALESVTFGADSQLTTICIGAFYYCGELTSFAIPANVTSIGEWAFQGCANLASVTFENINGWSAATNALSATDLKDLATAADYLTTTHCDKSWARA